MAKHAQNALVHKTDFERRSLAAHS